MSDEMDLFEHRGINYALWVWDPNWMPWSGSVSGMNYRFGPGAREAFAEYLQRRIAQPAFHRERLQAFGELSTLPISCGYRLTF